MSGRRARAGLLLLLAACVAGGEPVSPNEDEVAVWMMMNDHRRDRPVWDNMVVDLIRAKTVVGSARTWNQVVQMRIDAQPLIWSPALAEAARRLREEGAQPVARQRFDAAPALAQAGCDPGPAPALAMFATADRGMRAAYAGCLLNVIGFKESKNGSIEQYAGQEAMKAHWREVGISIGGAGMARRIVIVLADGTAKRCLGGTVFADADRDLRHGPGEGRAGVVVRCGAAQTVTGAGGLWSLRLDHVDAAEVRLESGAVTALRPLPAGARNTVVSWRLPDAKDVAAATRLLNEAAAPGLNPEQQRQRLSALLAGTLMAALDDAVAQQVAAATALLRDEFEAMRGRLMQALNEDAAAYRAACATERKRWGTAMSAWFAEAEGLGKLRTAVAAALAAPEATRAKPAQAARKQVIGAREDCRDPVFLAQYDTWLEQLESASPAQSPVAAGTGVKR